MESASQVNVPLRSGGKKMRKRRELDALVAHSLAKRANKKNTAGNGVNSQDQLLSPSTDEQEDIGWPKTVRTTSRTRNRKFSFIRLCGPLIFVTCISLSLGFMYWLYFDLRQQLYEYRQKIEEVSVTSQNLPETLQKWHETSKILEQNQTILFGKIMELQHSFSVYKEQSLNEKKDYQDDKYVAEFGAKIKAISDDVDRIKEEFSEFKRIETNLEKELDNIKVNYSNIVNTTAVQSSNSNVNYSTEIENTKKLLLDQINSFAVNLSTINDTLSQRMKILNDEISSNMKDYNELTDKCQNITSHVESIQNDWAKMKEDLLQIPNIRNSTLHLANAIKDVQSECNKYHYENVLRHLDDSQTTKKEVPNVSAAPNTVEVTPTVMPSITSVLSNTIDKQSNQPSGIDSNTTTAETPTGGKPKLLSIQTITKQFN